MKNYKWFGVELMVTILLAVLVTMGSSQGMGGFPYKIRGPPLPPRPPPLPGYVKKWHPHSFPGMLGPTRGMFRPQMMAMPTFATFPSYKRPHPNALPYRPTKSQSALVPLVIPTWKTQAFKGAASPLIKKPAGSVFQSPVNLVPQFEFLSKPEKPKVVPTAATPIKHIDDDKGPIHTIPAPNLSLADKPIVVAEMSQNNQQNVQLLQSQSYQIPDVAANGIYALGLHQYQVTEPTNDHSVVDVYTGQHKLVAPDPDPNLPAHKVPLSLDQHSTPTVNGKVIQPQAQDLTFGPAGEITNAELLQILNGYSQQQLVDSYGLPLAQQPQLQQHLLQQSQGIVPAINPTMQALQFNNGQLFLPDSNYMNQIQIQSQNIPSNANYNQPQYQNFNYDEQTKQNSVIPNFHDESHSDKSIRNIPSYSVGIPNYQPAESAIISNFVDNGNFIQNFPDPSLVYAQMSQKQETQQNSRFPNIYATLPSREVAETLASLQAAGQILSSPNQGYQEYQVATPMTIVVPDEADNFDEFETQASGGNVKQDSSKNSDKKNYADVEYEDYEDLSKEVKLEGSNNEKEQDATFGTRIKPKS